MVSEKFIPYATGISSKIGKSFLGSPSPLGELYYRWIIKKSDRKWLFLIIDYRGAITDHIKRWNRKRPPPFQNCTHHY
jgi:hypothetical protein